MSEKRPFFSWLDRLRNHTRQGGKKRVKKPSLEQLEQREVLSQSTFYFDFGPAASPVAQGYTAVSAQAYSASAGYGWQSVSGTHARRSGFGAGRPRSSVFAC